jgi:hypothetical protein
MQDWSLVKLARLFTMLEKRRLCSPKLHKALDKAGPIFEAVIQAYYHEEMEALGDGYPACIGVLLQSPKSAFWLGNDVFEGGEDNNGEYPLPHGLLGVVGSDPKYAYLWAHEYHKGSGRKWKITSNAYKSLCNSGEYAARYAVDVKERPFPPGEAAIIADPNPEWAMWYDHRLGTNLSEDWNQEHPDQPQIDTSDMSAVKEPEELS